MSTTLTRAIVGKLLRGEDYEFFAIADGMRMPLRIDAICTSDAEASLVALALSTRIIGVEVLREGELIFRAPKRDPRILPDLRLDTPVMGHG